MRLSIDRVFTVRLNVQPPYLELSGSQIVSRSCVIQESFIDTLIVYLHIRK